MRYEVLLTAAADADLSEIVDWIAEHDSPERADHVLQRIADAVDGLAHFPDRGSFPKELLAVGMREYRETRFKPWRIIYRVEGRRVLVYLIADARRDLRELLARRLLGA